MAATTAKLSYQRLKHEAGFDDDLSDPYNRYRSILDKLIRRSKSRRRLHIGRQRPRVRIPSLKRFLRRKARAVKVTWRKVYKRLKESRSHFGDLFAGNYMFMQVTPTPLQYGNDTKYYYGNANRLSSSIKANHLHDY